MGYIISFHDVSTHQILSESESTVTSTEKMANDDAHSRAATATRRVPATVVMPRRPSEAPAVLTGTMTMSNERATGTTAVDVVWLNVTRVCVSSALQKPSKRQSRSNDDRHDTASMAIADSTISFGAEKANERGPRPYAEAFDHG